MTALRLAGTVRKYKLDVCPELPVATDHQRLKIKSNIGKQGESGCHQPLLACYECHGRAVIDSSYISGFEITQAHWSLLPTHHPALKAVYDRFLSQILKTAWQTRHIPGTQCSRQLAPHNEI